MPIDTRTYRHYRCDAPGCDKEEDSEKEFLANEHFRTAEVDAGEAYEVYHACFCIDHATSLHHVLLSLGFEKRLR
jgi:hypothetical protein